MYKSRVVKLVFLNSVLALSACSRTCEPDDDKDRLAQNQGKPRTSCHGSSRGIRGGGTYFVHVPGGGPNANRPGSGTVGRGGFGATGRSTVS